MTDLFTSPLHKKAQQRVSDAELRAYMRTHCVDHTAVRRAFSRGEALQADGALRYRRSGEQRGAPLVRDGTSDPAASLRLMRTFRNDTDCGKFTVAAIAEKKPTWCSSTSYEPLEDPLIRLLRRELEKRKEAMLTNGPAQHQHQRFRSERPQSAPLVVVDMNSQQQKVAKRGNIDTKSTAPQQSIHFQENIGFVDAVQRVAATAATSRRSGSASGIPSR